MSFIVHLINSGYVDLYAKLKLSTVTFNITITVGRCRLTDRS